MHHVFRLLRDSVLSALAVVPLAAQDGISIWGASRYDSGAYALPTAAISAGGYGAVIVRNDGRAFVLGGNLIGDAPALPPATSYTAFVVASSVGFSLRSDGQIVSWGANGGLPAPALPAGTTYVEVSSRGDHAVARRSDGTAVAWGNNWYGQTTLPTPPPGVSVQKVEAGAYVSALLLSNGTIQVVGLAGTAGLTTVPPLPPGVTYTDVWAGEANVIAARSDGDLVAGGAFTLAGGGNALHLARWNGVAWARLGSGLPLEVTALAHTPAGDILAAEAVPPSSARVSRWNGQSWTPLGSAFNGRIHDLVATPSGDAIALGEFTLPVEHIARFDGTAWVAVDAGPDGPAYCALVDPTDEVRVGGAFDRTGNVVAARLGRLVANCPPAETVIGPGCPGGGGQSTLRAAAPAWLGGVLRCEADNVAASSVALVVIGFGPQSVPLATIHPAAGPGCTLLATADAQLLTLPDQGRVRWQLPLPADPGLVALDLYEQVVIAELVGGAVTGLAASNGLRLTMGIFR